MRSPTATLGFLGMALVVQGCASTIPHSGDPSPGSYRQKMADRVSLARRSYAVHVPQGYDPQRPHPLVVVIHGAFSSASGIEKATGFSALADREGFIAVYPNGIGLFGLLQHWNASFCCGKAMRDGIDDVDFVARVVKDAATRLAVDLSRVYVVGYSNGGMLAHRIAALRPDVIAALAVSSATAGGAPEASHEMEFVPEPLEPVPVIAFHGRDDDSIPYDGGLPAGKKSGLRAASVADSIAFWVRHNRCVAEPVRDELYSGAVVRERFSCPDSGADVVLHSLEGWGHDWPGGHFTGAHAEDHPLHGFDAAELIWKFFQEHRRAD